MTSHEWCTARLSDYLDDELSSDERTAVDGHVAGCAECRRTLEDLRQVIATAATLSPLAPRVDLWDGIAERLFSFTLPELAAASLLIAALSGGAATLLLRRSDAGQARQAGNQAPAHGENSGTPRHASAVSLQPDAISVVPAIGYADAQYDAAVTDLERALQNGRGRLDQTTVAVVEENLAIIDRAIAEARSALGADPSNGYLSGHLMEARRRKLDLLRRAAELAEAN
jgi:anti-sigma factor RsiW